MSVVTPRENDESGAIAEEKRRRLEWLDRYVEEQGRLERQIALFRANHAYRLVVQLPSIDCAPSHSAPDAT